jgi:hypothetical protein
MNPTTTDPTIDELIAEVRELRRQVDELTSGRAQLTVRRLAVVDDEGLERVVAEVTDFRATVDVLTGEHRAGLNAYEIAASVDATSHASVSGDAEYAGATMFAAPRRAYVSTGDEEDEQ